MMQNAIETTLEKTHFERLLAAFGVSAMSIGAAILWYFDPTKTSFLPACPMLKLTGFACPGCGMTRGLHALLHGDLLTAIDYNALIPFFVAFAAYLFISMVLVVIRGRGIPKWTYTPQTLFAVLVVMFLFAFVRNLPFYPFNWLYP
jgi:hypothetical protein